MEGELVVFDDENQAIRYRFLAEGCKTEKKNGMKNESMGSKSATYLWVKES